MKKKQFQSFCIVSSCYTVIFLVVFLLASTVVYAQLESAYLPESIHFEHVNIDSGLASSHVNAITQDNSGFMWFGTTQGLNRFDGYDYLLFGKNRNNLSRDIGRNRVVSLYAEDETLWIGTNHLISYSLIEDTLTRHFTSEGSGINVIKPDGKGNLLLGGHQLGLHVFNIEQGDIVSHYFEPQMEGGVSNTITDITVAEDGMVWLGTPSGVYMFNPTTSQFSQPAILLGLTGHISSVETDESQYLWIGSWKGLYQYDYINDSLLYFSRAQVGFAEIHSLFVDSRGYLWVGSNKQGVSTYDEIDGLFTHHKSDGIHPQEIGGGSVVDIYEDDVQSIWFAVQGYGLYRYNPNAQLFDLHLADQTDPHALGYQQVGPIVVDDRGTAWIGTDGGGLFALEKGENRFEAYRARAGGLSNNGVLSLAQAADETIWIGMWEGGLNQLDPETGQFRYWSHEDGEDGLLTDNIFTLHADSQNQLWISAWDHGVQLLDLDSEKFIDPFLAHTERGGNEVEPGLQNISVMAILEASDGTMWFGGYGGLEQYNPRTGLFRHFLANDLPTVRDQISSNTVFVLHEDKNGIIWVGTDAGLDRIDPVTRFISTYTVSEGLPDNVIVGILEDEDEDLWLSTKRGLSLFRRESNSFQNFSMNSGLQGEEFNRFSYAQRDGTMYFGGTNGFNHFDPLNVKQMFQADTPRIELTDFLLAGKSVYAADQDKNIEVNRAINASERITLSAEDNMFSIKFAALEYTRPGQVRYRYKLEGHRDDWIERSSAERIATYTNIDPGTYTFRVQAFSADSVLFEETSIEIVVSPYWWETPWFNVILATAIMITLVVGYRMRLRATTDKFEIGQKEREAKIYRQKNSELQRMNTKLMTLNEEKDDMLGIVAHDLRNPLGVMLMNLDLLISHHEKLSPEKRKKKLRQVEQMVRTTHEMADKLLTEGREKGITAEIEPVLVASILDELCQQYEAKAKQKRIKLGQQWETHRQIGVAADPTMFRQVIDNLVSNGIKYSYPNSSVTLRIGQVKNSVRVIVQDWGQGMTDEDLKHVFGRYTRLSAKPTQGEQSVGMGLYNVKTLIDSMEGQVEVTSDGRGKGCTFTVTLPRATIVNSPTPIIIPTFRPAKRPAKRPAQRPITTT